MPGPVRPLADYARAGCHDRRAAAGSALNAGLVRGHVRGLFVSLCPSCRCVIRRVCGVTAGRRAWLCLDGRVSERKRYPSDLSDERWALIEPVITAWKAAHRSVSGHQGAYELREIVNAILYQSRDGLPAGVPAA